MSAPEQVGSDDLWALHQATGDIEVRNRLVLRYAPLVKYVAGRLRAGLPDNVDQADLLSEGVIGLMDAIEKFDPTRGLQFQTYAVPRIRVGSHHCGRAATRRPYLEFFHRFKRDRESSNLTEL